MAGDDTGSSNKLCVAFRFPFFLAFLSALVGGMILMFSGMGYAERLYGELAKADGAGGIACLLIGAIGMIVFMFFEGGSDNPLGILINPIAVTAGLGGLLLGSLWLLPTFPAALLSIGQIGPALVVFALHQTFFSFLSTPVFFEEVRLPLNIVALATLSAWLVWLFVTPAPWNKARQVQYGGSLGCNTSGINAPGAGHYELCAGAYVLWFMPALLSISTASTSLLLGLLNNSLEQAAAEESGGDGEGNGMGSRVLGILLAVTVAAVYILISFGGASDAVWDGVATMAVTNLFIIGAVMTYSSPHASSMQGQVDKVPLLNKVSGLVKSDALKGAFALVAYPAIIVYLVLRAVFCHGSAKPAASSSCCGGSAGDGDGDGDGDGGDKGTGGSSSLDLRELDMLNHLHWGKILSSTVFLGTFFMTLFVVVGKLTNIILSKLNAHLAQYPLGTVLVLWFAVGVFMFSIAIPGVPVYVTGGVIVTSAAQGTIGFWGGLVLSTFVCLFIKLAAVVIQQKIIGEIFGSKVGVRRMVGVNSITIRAIKAILSVPGVSFRKSAILCGGPDWPTSVLTGILKLPLLEMLAGTVPVYVVLAPCCAAGALMIKAAEGGDWGTISATTLTAASMGQGFALCSALYFIESYAGQNRAELEAMADDEEVKALDEEAAKVDEVKNELTRWDNDKFTHAPKAYLAGSAGAMSFAVYIYALFPKKCFQDFAVTDSIERDLGGNSFNVVKPLGWVALALFFVGLVLSKLFNKWVTANMPVAGPAGEAPKGNEVTAKKGAPKFVV